MTNSANPISTLTDQVLRIEARNGPVAGMGQHLVQLAGTCPPEHASSIALAHRLPDGRGLLPLVIRFESQHEDNLFSLRNVQDGVRAGIWSSLNKVLPNAALPEITRPIHDGFFDQIDLAFPSRNAFRVALSALKEIRVGTPSANGEQGRVYILKSFATTVPGNVFRIDCINVPLDEEKDLEAFKTAAEHITAGIGQLLGIAKLVVSSTDWLPESPAGLHRLYVQLDRALIAAPLGEVAIRLPSHLLWHGAPYKLIFTGCHLRGTWWSADFPPEEHYSEGDNGSGSPTGQASRSTDAANTSNAAKRRRTGGG